jgi:hypothetical protein
VEGLPRMTNELNRGTPAPVRLSIRATARHKRDDNEIDRRREPKDRARNFIEAGLVMRMS